MARSSKHSSSIPTERSSIAKMIPQQSLLHDYQHRVQLHHHTVYYNQEKLRLNKPESDGIGG
jgi:hypothetical protein